MARMTKCVGCKYCNPMKATCNIYKEGIPRDIWVELESCDHYILSKSDDTDDDDLPIAKGR